MREFPLQLLYTTTLVACVSGFYENVAPPPWLLTTTMQRLQPKHFAKFPRPLQRPNIPKFLYWKRLLELECFKEICSYMDQKDHSNRQNPLEGIKQKQMPPLRNEGAGGRWGYQTHGFHKANDNQLKAEQQGSRKYTGNERIILWAPETRFGEKQANVPPFGPNRRPLMDSEKFQATTKEDVDQNHHGFPHSALESHPRQNEKQQHELPTVPPHDSFSQLFQDSAPMRPSLLKHSEKPPSVYHRPHRIQPYEVEEIIEEQFEVDVNDDKEEERTSAFEEKLRIPESNIESDNFGSVIGDSVNTILKGLIGPLEKRLPEKEMSKDVFPPKKLKDLPYWREINSSNKSFLFRTSTSRSFTERTKESLPDAPWNDHTTTHSLKRIHPTVPPNLQKTWRQESAQVTQKFNRKSPKADLHSRLDGSRGFEFTPSSEKDPSPPTGSLPTDDAPRPLPQTVTHPPPPLQHSRTEESPHRYLTHHDPQHNPSPSPSPSPLSPPDLSLADSPKNLDLLKNLFPDFGHPNFTWAEKTTESPILPQTTLHPSLFTPETPPEDPDTSFTREEDADRTTETTETTETLPHSDTQPPDGDLTQPNFLEFTDRPTSFDLFDTTAKPDSRKDQEPLWKNSRKMHFAKEVQLTNASKAGSPPDAAEQRRSDILIAEDLSDYLDNDSNLSTPTYLEKLKQNHPPLSPHPLNFTTDTLIPLLPVIINDLRENKIPPSDHSILSQLLGRYWNPILALSNFTNLDMLPLLKMKDEKDLENVLQNFLPEDLPPAGTTENDYAEDDYNHSYDYMDEYKELYKDILGQELGEKKRRFRPRRDAEDDLKTLEATREYFESIEEERNDDGSDYFFEDIIYDEVSDGEDSSVFELMEVADVVVGKET